MQVLIRTDASRTIGTGHVMRCLVLADRLAQTGASCLFVCREFEDHLAGSVEARGHRCVLLEVDPNPPSDTGYSDTPLAHAGWLAADWRRDAQSTIEIGETLQGVDLAIVDHYALDYRWEARIKPHTDCLLVLDDLADRQHCADMLVDQNYGHNTSDYAGLAAGSCRVLAGAQYALLRPQFAAVRPEALTRRHHPGSDRHLLIYLGGGDTDEALGRVVEILCQARPVNLGAVTLIAGNALNGKRLGNVLRSKVAARIEIVERVGDMAGLMLRADLAIGGGGITGWERCALGLPTLVVTLADNQKSTNRQLARDGHIFACVEPEDLNQDLMARFIDMDAATYRTISGNAATVTDGLGADRVMEAFGQAIEVVTVRRN